MRAPLTEEEISNDQLGPDNYLLGIPRRERKATNDEDDEDTEEDDRDGLKALDDRISHLEEKQKKIILVGSIIGGGLIIALIVNFASENATEERRWGLEDRR